MKPPAQSDIVTDTSVLINFLNVDRLDLFARSNTYRFFVTEHVKREITDHYPKQIARLEEGIASGALREIVVNTIEELVTFAELSTTKRLGLGECAAITAAVHRQLLLAIDDRQAIKATHRLCQEKKILTTTDVMVSFIQEGLLTVAEADQIKAAWETQYRFKLEFSSFQDKL